MSSPSSHCIYTCWLQFSLPLSYSFPYYPFTADTVDFLVYNFSSAGVPRETEEEKMFGDFPIFDDPANPFSSMNFMYDGLQFDRLTKLMEFNTLLCIDTIKKELEEIVEKKKQYIPKFSIKDLVNTVKRMTSFNPVEKGSNDLKLKVSLENELTLRRLSRYSSVSDQEASEDTDDSDFSDALENIPDETTTLWGQVVAAATFSVIA